MYSIYKKKYMYIQQITETIISSTYKTTNPFVCIVSSVATRALALYTQARLGQTLSMITENSKVTLNYLQPGTQMNSIIPFVSLGDASFSKTRKILRLFEVLSVTYKFYCTLHSSLFSG